MSARLAATAVIGLIATGGCGRIGFGTRAGDDGPDDGGPGDPACVARSFPLAVTPVRSLEPVLVWNGAEVAAVWIEDPADSPSVHFTTSPLEGPPTPGVTFGLLGGSDSVDLVWDGASWRFAWGDESQADREILRSVDGQPPQPVTSNGRFDSNVRVEALGNGTTAYLWAIDGPAQTRDLVMAVLDAAGTKIVDEAPVAADVEELTLHDLVWTGSELVTFYSTTTQILMVRMAPDGSLIGGPIQIVDERAFVSVTASWVGDRFLLTWFSAGGHLVYLSPTGEPLSPFVSTPETSALSFGISSAIGPTSDLVVWNDIATSDGYLLPVSRDGTLGELITLPDTTGISAAWVGTGWAYAASQGAVSTDVNLVQLCL